MSSRARVGRVREVPSATAAGLVPFTLGTETYGSIVSPSLPLWGDRTQADLRTGRTQRGDGALLGASTRSVRSVETVLDTAIVLKAINGSDPLGPVECRRAVRLRSGRVGEGSSTGARPRMVQGRRFDRMPIVPHLLPQRRRVSNSSRCDCLKIEHGTIAGSRCSRKPRRRSRTFTRADIDDELSWQDDAPWPNTFRQTWFMPAVELVQAGRVRRQVMDVMHRFMNEGDPGFDAIICPGVRRQPEC